jgi:protein TonB
MGTLSGSAGSPTASNNLLKVAAAIGLLLVGAGGGYWFFSQKAGAIKAPATEQAAITPAARPAVPSANLPPVMPAADPVPQPAPVLTATPQTDIVLESRPTPVRDASAPHVQPTTPTAEPRIVATRRNPMQIEQLKAPKPKATAARLDANSAAPTMVGSLTLGDNTNVNSLLAADSLGAAPPPAPLKPALGGQLQPPQIQSSTPPVYPPNARALKLQGDVELDALVDETGKVAETTVISGPLPLVAAARDSVQKWKYKPAQLNGKPIAVHTRVSVRFNLAQ